MTKASHVSPVHIVVALVAAAAVTASAVYFLEPKSTEDPFAKSEELRLLIEKFPDDVKTKIVKEMNVRDQRYDMLPYDRLEKLVSVLENQPAAVATLKGEAREKRVEKILELIDMRESIPPQLRGVGVIERVGVKLPLDLAFRDHTGQKVTLGSYFQSGKPVILTLNYSDCPQLCHIQLNNLVATLHDNKIIPGDGFEIVTVSINPDEAPNRAAMARRNYLQVLETSGAAWHFLTTTNNDAIKQLAATVGFGYRFDPVTKDYAHSSTLILCSPTGVVTQYYQGIEYKAEELRKRIAEAAAGTQVASAELDNYFNCKVYDGSRPYALSATRVLKVVSAISAFLLVLGLTILWMIPSKKPVVLPPLQGDKHA